MNGRDLTGKPRNLFVIDLFGLAVDEVKARFPEVYQWLLERVKPEREHNPRGSRREKWWIFGEPCPKFRAALPPLHRFIATVKTSKHRTFQYLGAETLPDSKLIACTVDSNNLLGVLSSRLHVIWAIASGSALGVGNDPTYVKTKSFEAFPFPMMSGPLADKIGEFAIKIDTHRKRQQAEHPSLTLTDTYNILEKLRAGDALTTKEKVLHQQGVVSLLRELHDDLDRTVFEAYGWHDLADKLVGRPGGTTPLPDKPADQAEAEEELLLRLVALNKRRAQEEAGGMVRWLRPEHQAPNAMQLHADLPPASAASDSGSSSAAVATGKRAWPKSIREQIEAVRSQLALAPTTTDMLAATYKRKPVKSVAQVLSALEGLGHVQLRDDVWYLT